MSIGKPFIHLFSTSTGKFFYDVNTNVIVRISDDIYELLKRNTYDALQSEKIEKLKRKGFLKSNKIQYTEHPLTNLIPYYLESKVSAIILQVTQNCNLRCEYCAYSGGYYNRKHNPKKMSIGTAKKAFDFLMNHSQDCEHVTVGFYGGEPLLEYELIKKIIAYAETRSRGKNILYSITTNGTLIDEEKIKLFQQIDMRLTVSLDGPQNIHDEYRKFANSEKGSQQIVVRNLEMIKRKYPQYFKENVNINAVVDQTKDFDCVRKYFDSLELFEDIGISYSTINECRALIERRPSEEFLCNHRYEYFKLFLRKIGWLEECDISRVIKGKEYLIGELNREKGEITRSQLPDKSHHGGPCVPGNKSLLITTEGEFYPCEKVPELEELYKVGCLSEGFDIEKIEAMLNIEKITADKCHNCWAYDYCSQCIAQTNCINHLCAKEMEEYCESIRAGVEGRF